MSRSTALLGMLMSLAPLACATTVRPGLANVPALGSSLIADASVHDVVANGRDSCEQGLRPGPLRYQVPPCPGLVRGAADPNVASWGRLVGDGRQLIRSSWYICAIPGVAIMITVLCLNLIGDGLNDALNPKLRDR